MAVENEDITLFRDMLLRCLEKEVIPHYDQWEKDGWMPKEAWLILGAAGMLGPDMPEEYGAAGAPFEVALMILEETCRLNLHALSTALNVHANIVMPYINNLGTAEQKARWLPGMVTGEIVGSIGMTEPGAGSDLAGMRTNAVPDGDEWVINGSKTFITNGLHCGLIVLAAKTDTTKGAKGISLFLVDSSLPGFKKGKGIKKMGQHSNDTAELFFDNLRVPANALLGEENKGFIYLMQELPRERLGLGSQAVGACEGAMAITVDYVTQRKAFGSTVAQFQNTRFKMAELRAQLELTKAYLKQCEARFKLGAMTTEEASILKLMSTELQVKLTHECLQLFGGYGYTEEYPISRFFTDARVQTIYAGTSEIMKEVIARGELGR
ncbi:MAG: acyl-CoA dehydrogenase family protein [Gammaproteobacteria bacterium]|uniref:acyl-CoA dehydrogenase family protein n=1 Tax=Limnobacter sp. TaxID=2003368 RepID=UPI001D252A7F|nr:acyl-CoA dehydrogenase family protein [Limnobacter sp.]MBU0783331.1 acyl-CoA dehydrogenase family protein [Gammaproteobacteria bacterium]MBU0850550.1 acyl-CoA dehydrogenase family protein [Gammaproteobacteria bacterium]MBU1268344.1 acyl-CoA dehydrogenase family protein [Gammaproteobacteria bacterium]MBU1530188.1 acyl-CoA dehydrogenase family protein [Gammaproteobacteria bacterium]MBU1780562.1 acyl-CoA dehydrogenase family protein [Gammaproteobacteria bacterium]